ncbi:MAG: metallophosphoesterase [Candidatus Thiodiazotropha endolucinida]
MKVAVLHISDIHLRSATDEVANQASTIASGCYDYARNSDACLIVVTGDIAYSGSECEFKACSVLLTKIRQLIENEADNQKVDIFLAPGNHDCALLPENIARNTIIEQIVSKNELASDNDIVDLCTKVQDEYFKFRDSITTSKQIHDHKLWTEYEVEVAGRTVRISSINAAWMSRVPEIPGQLVFPVNLFKNISEQPADLRLTLIHHPLNWYAQKSYHPLRQLLQQNSHAILSGHEHSIRSGGITDTSEGNSLFFEAPALQPHEHNSPLCFSCLLFDLEGSEVKEKRCSISSRGLSTDEKEIIHQFPQSLNNPPLTSGISSEMISILSDAGGNFSHPDKGELRAEDIFVYPELKECISEHGNIVNANNLKITGKDSYKILILGDDKSGKTFLLYRYFKDIYSNERLPLYIKAYSLKSVTDKKLTESIKKLSEAQYTNSNDFLLAKKCDRVALLDDIDRCPGGSKNKYKLISFLERNFGSVILTGSNSMELSELVDKNIAESLENYSTYEICSFGHVMRHKLIKKWCLCGNIETTIDLDKKAHETETLINSVLGRNLVPSRPIYLLILLQSSQSHNQEEVQNSGLSYYYQFLITKSLRENGVRPDKFNEIFNYISQLAWFYDNEDASEIHLNSLREFNNIFSNKFTSVDFDTRINLLTRAKILSKSGDYYSFLYPYIYYFFLGKYLATNLYRPEIMDMVSRYCETLNIRKNASTVLFLSHHSNDPWLIDKISNVSNTCFDTAIPLNIEEDVNALNDLVDSTGRLTIDNLDVERNQERQRKIADDLDYSTEHNQDHDNEEASAIELVNKFNLLLKTNEILGQITKNYYGSIERDKKEEYISTIFNSSLRMLRTLFDEIVRDPELFVKELHRAMIEHSDKPKEHLEEHSRKIAFRLIGMICTGMIGKTAKFVSSETLREDINSVVAENNSNAIQLLSAATQLLQPGKLPFDDLSKLANSLRENIFAFTILQSLVSYHLHMFHTTDFEKQKLCSIVDITMSNARSLEMRGKQNRLGAQK